ncbi:MAG TPA: hypothetical protein DIC31_05575 [Rhizobiales bacterium]|nr:hypothetical protein [Hyphomicrobiales bacterium]
MSLPTNEETTPAEPVRARARRLHDQRMSRPIVKIVPDRRRHRRVPVEVVGRFMREDRQEYPCQVIELNAHAARKNFMQFSWGETNAPAR